MKIKYFSLILCTSSILFAMEEKHGSKKRKREIQETSKSSKRRIDIHKYVKGNYNSINNLYDSVKKEKKKRINGFDNLYKKINQQEDDIAFLMKEKSKQKEEITQLKEIVGGMYYLNMNNFVNSGYPFYYSYDQNSPYLKNSSTQPQLPPNNSRSTHRNFKKNN